MMQPLSPRDAVEAPELLVLASLDATLVALRVAMVAAFPELLNELGRQRDPPLLLTARRLSDRACLLERDIRGYRDALERVRASHAHSDDLPFLNRGSARLAPCALHLRQRWNVRYLAPNVRSALEPITKMPESTATE